MWMYECSAGTYRESSLVRLLWSIFVHRFNHLVEDGKFKD